MTADDLEAVAAVHQAAFPRQGHSRDWIECNFRAFPRVQFHVAEAEEGVIAFIQWTQKSGFRPEVVLELEQLAVHPQAQGRGVGTAIIQGSLPLVRAQLAGRGATLKHVLVTTRLDNHAQRLYRKTLGAEVEAELKNLYSSDEVIMIARNVTMGSG